MIWMRMFVSASLLALASSTLLAAEPAVKKIPVLVDTDFGNGLSDAYALADLLARPEIEIVGITTCVGETSKRAQMIGRFLSAAKRLDIPFAAGAPPQPEGTITRQHQYQYHPAVIFNRMGKAQPEPAAEFLAAKLKARPGEITILCLGPVTNVARLLADHPECKGRIRRVVVSIADGDFPEHAAPQTPLDAAALERLQSASIPIVKVVDRREHSQCKIAHERANRLFDPPTLVSLQLESLAQMEAQSPADEYWLPGLAAVAALSEEESFAWKDGAAKHIRLATPAAEHALLAAALRRLQKLGSPAARPQMANRTQFIEREKFPAMVHAFEDYETDIEKRWWMTGRLTVADSPAGRFRYCTGILTQDFDDRQGNLDAMYNAVVFNPVPGPPMGPKTRLTFRYYLEGTDTLRVQLYSLSNGYHRYLTVSGLPQGEWRDGTVDMTAMRRPDGSGGPLAADERIDDIQFYVDARATVKIDSMILYDADDRASRPFPKRVLFTGWFDTGKQGVEWPGTFDIVPHEKPRSWKCAQSVPNEERKQAWIRVDLRGPRPLGTKTRLQFDYLLSGGNQCEIRLVDSESQALGAASLTDLASGAWSEMDLPFTPTSKASVREIWFLVPLESKLRVDNLLLYEPGE